MDTTSCPSADVLADYVLGKVSAAETAAIVSHVETCPACQTQLETLDTLSDTVITFLRRAAIGEAEADDSLLDEVLSKIEAITSNCGSSSAGNDQCSQAPFLGNLAPNRLIRKLGEGGMGCVYLAEDEALQKQVAVKVPYRRLFESDQELDRVLTEARAAARLKHVGIVPVLYFGREADGTCYIVMEYVEGQSLAERLLSGPIHPAEAAALSQPVPRRWPKSTSKVSCIAT